MNGTPQKKPPSKRRNELVLLNVWFCLGVFLYHILARSAVSLNRLSWQFALIIFIQRLICVSLLGFFFLSGLLYLTDLALRLAESKRTFLLAQRIDRAGYLIYLYHGLAITLFNIAATRLSITRYGTQILLQLLLVLPAVIGGSLLWQRLWASFKKQVTPSPLHQ